MRDTNHRRKNKYRRKEDRVYRRTMIILGTAPFAIVIIAYIIGVIMFSGKFLPNTYINGDNVAGLTANDVNEALTSSSSQGGISLVKQDDTEEEILFKDIDYVKKYTSDIGQIQKTQSPFLWFTAYFQSQDNEVEIVPVYDKEKLKNQVDNLKCISSDDIQDPVDAKIEKKDTGFTVVKEVDGNRIDKEKLLNTIQASIDNDDFTINLESNNCYLKAKIKSTDKSITDRMSNLSKYNNLSIKLDLVDAEEVIDFKVFKDWISEKDNKVVFNEKKIASYVEGLAKKYNTYQSKRNFKTTKSGTIKVGGSDYDLYGFLLDEDETKSDILDLLQKGKSQKLKASWEYTALCRGAKNGDIGNTYIEVDLTTQHLWYYKDGKKKYETDFVSGMDWDPDRRTPTGVFRVYDKARNATLVGENYETPVDYWMPFTYTGCGLHDAPWQPYFGGDLYKTNGSHGCLNLSYDSAQEMYDLIDYNTPVIIYNS